MIEHTAEYLDAFIVSVDYTDLLSITLPHNRRHFRRVNVITSPEDLKNLLPVLDANKADVFVTDAFYRHGAKFNKWLALEEGLDYFGRKGWTCLMDADILWPKHTNLDRILLPGYLYTPRRRIYPTVPASSAVVPDEGDWHLYEVHRQEKEFAGYSQVFHSDDPALGVAPWHQTDWTHAGGADSFFQAKWAEERKIRPGFHALHLGPPGVNWFGRSTPRADGSVPEGAEGRAADALKIWAERRMARARGDDDPFAGEKISRRGPGCPS